MAKRKVADLNDKPLDTGGEVGSMIERGEGKGRKQSEAGKEEKEKRESEMRTQGRKGCKMQRISLATSPENYDFIHIMSKLSGKTMTQYINGIITEYREAHPGLYERAQEVLHEAGKDVNK